MEKRPFPRLHGKLRADGNPSIRLVRRDDAVDERSGPSGLPTRLRETNAEPSSLLRERVAGEADREPELALVGETNTRTPFFLKAAPPGWHGGAPELGPGTALPVDPSVAKRSRIELDRGNLNGPLRLHEIEPKRINRAVPVEHLEDRALRYGALGSGRVPPQVEFGMALGTPKETARRTASARVLRDLDFDEKRSWEPLGRLESQPRELGVGFRIDADSALGPNERAGSYAKRPALGGARAS